MGKSAWEIEQVVRGEMIYRKLGKTGAEVSIIGLGGSHISKAGGEEEAITLIRSAIDAGITFMDNSWDYAEGQSEIWMGKALRDGYRDKVFLMSKIDARTKDLAAKQIDESLLRMQVEYVDLAQFHEVVYPHDPDMIFGEDGAAEAMSEAVRSGKVRHAGFTGHKDPFIHLRMLEIAKERGFEIETVQMPLNVMDAHFRSFERQVLPVLLEENIGAIGMKSLAGGQILESKVVSAIECIQYVLNLPVSTLVCGIDNMDMLKQALHAVKTFEFWDDQRRQEILGRTRDLAGRGKFEPFKTSARFDLTNKNPQWLGI